jgi:hypothetical protein
MTTSKKLTATLVKSVRGGVEKTGQFAILNLIRGIATPSGETSLNVAMPVKSLPELLDLIQALIETFRSLQPLPVESNAQ